MKNSRKMIFERYDYATFSSFFAYSSGSVVVPVALVSLANELGFSLESGGFSAGGALQIGRSVPMVVSMLLCGFVAGRYGKRQTFGYAVLLMGIGMVLCSFAPSYGIVFSALAIAGLGEGVIEGLATPFVSDLHTEESGRYVNFTHSFWSIGVLVTVLLSGFLLTLGVSWRYLTFGAGLLALIPVVLLLAPQKQGKEYPEHPDKKNWKIVCMQAFSIMRKDRFWLFFAAMFVAGGGEFCLTFWCASYIQLTFSSAAWTGGVGTAFFATGMIIGRAFGGYIIKQEQLRSLIIYAAILGVAITLLFPLIDNLWIFFIVLLISGIAAAPFWPSIQTYAVDRMKNEDSTMMYILLSCAGIPGCGFFTWLLGYIGSKYGNLVNAFYLIPACFATIIIFIGYDYFKNESKK